MNEKQILITIHPEHAVNILNGKKTLELRTWVPKNYQGWVNVYVKESKPYLCRNYKNTYEIVKRTTKGVIEKNWNYSILNGQVVARFWFKDYDLLEYDFDYNEIVVKKEGFVNGVDSKYLNKLCLTFQKFLDYAENKTTYAWHIDKLQIFDKPKELSEFYKIKTTITNFGNKYNQVSKVEKAPQKFIYVWEKDNE